MTVFDVEADGLYATKFHVLSYQDGDKVKSLFSYKDMKRWLLDQECLVGHNITLWDIPNLERVLNIKIKARLIDTLGLCWYLYPAVKKPGLEYWGDLFKEPKPFIKDWVNLSREEYQNRCETDVRINAKLWERQQEYLSMLYNVPVERTGKLPIVYYLAFKLACAREQERSKWKLDIGHCNAMVEELTPLVEEKKEALRAVMPKVPVYKTKSFPAKPFKKDGTLSTQGALWRSLLTELALPANHTEDISWIADYKEPNPSSHIQRKDWLFSLGWEPETFKEEREEDGTIRKIPQIKLPHSPDLCPSVLRLAEEVPDVEIFAGLSILEHRLGVFKGFLRDVDENGYLTASISGFTNTLRFKHKIIVNLPGVDKLYGAQVRAALTCDEGCELMGADMASLESVTKRHYMYPYDPEYVNEMSQPGFDEHLDLAMHHGVITREQYAAHMDGTEDFGKVRKRYKPVNYSAVYGIKPPKLSRELKVKEKEAKALLDAYWKRNWAVLEVVKELQIKTVRGQMWLLNPVSNLYYSLRFEKDKFSTLNQGTGVYCFDKWIQKVLDKRYQLTGQFHDEGVWEIKLGNREKGSELLYKAIDEVNEELNLNVKLGIGSPQFGQNYAEVH